MNTVTIAGMTFSSALIERLGWVLLHTVWQFLAIGVIAAIAMRLMRNQSASARYGMLVVTLIAMLAGPIATWQWLVDDYVPTDVALAPQPHFAPTTATETSADSSASNVEPSTDEPQADRSAETLVVANIESGTRSAVPVPWDQRLESTLQPWLSVIVAGWILGVVFCALRPLIGWRTLRRLRREGVSTVSDEVTVSLKRVAERLGMRRVVQVMGSTLAGAPMVVGYLRPVILLPASLLSNIPVAELESILAHELAHIRRHDFVVNLFQAAIETVFFYHPVVWWLSRQIRIEREHCCDDLVVASLNDRVAYGRALVTIAECCGRSPSLALSAKAGSLPARVRRILGTDCSMTPSEEGESPSESDPSQHAALQQPRVPVVKALTPGPRWLVSAAILALIGAAIASMFSTGVAEDEAPVAATPTERYIAMIPDIGTVEMVGVGFHQSRRTDWWQANGQRLAADPHDESLPLMRLIKARFPGSQEKCREFGLRITGVPEEEQIFGLQFRFDGYSEGLHRVVLRGPSEFRFGTIPIDKSLSSRRASVRVCFGESEKFVRTFDVSGQKLNQPLENKHARKADEQFQPVRVESVKGQSQLLLKPYDWGTDPPINEYPPAAITKDGERHESIQAGGRKGFSAYLYDVPREQIDHFEYAFYLYDHWVTFENISLDAGQETEVAVAYDSLQDEAPQPDDAAQDDENVTADADDGPEEILNRFAWGEVTNGLRARLIPVSAAMSEDAIDPSKRVARFASKDDIAFVVEVENVTKKPLKLLDTRYGPNYGKSSGKPASDWFGQFLFAIDQFDDEGKRLPVPEFELIESGMSMLGFASPMLEPGQKHQFLIRPTRWLSGFQYRPQPGRHHIAVRYRGLPQGVEKIIRKSRHRELVGAVEGDVVTPRVSFEIGPQLLGTPPLVWGPPTNGLRAAVSLEPHAQYHAYGTKPMLHLHIRNVNDVPVAFSAGITMSDSGATITDKDDQPVKVTSTMYSGWVLTTHVVLQPNQTAVFHAGNLGIAENEDEANAFKDITNRKVIAPEGVYRLKLTSSIGSFQLKDGEGNVLAPKEDDWKGRLETGAAPFRLGNPPVPDEIEPFECLVVDAETGEPVEGKELTIHFRFRRPGPREDQPETIASVFWGPKSPADFRFYVPKKVSEHPDRDTLVIDWGVRHPDYEVFRAEKPVRLIDVMRGHPKSAAESFRRIRLTRAEQDDNSADRRQGATDSEVPTDPLERTVTLKVEQTPLQRVLEQAAAQAGLTFKPDLDAVGKTGLDLTDVVDFEVTDEPLASTLNLLIPWRAHPGLFRKIRGDQLVLTTIQADQERIAAKLPSVLKPHYRKGLSVNLDADGQVEFVHVGSILTDELLGQIASVPGIKKLEISSSKELTADGLKHLAKMQQLESLQAFSLNEPGQLLGDAVIQSVVGIPSLKSLSIIECGTTDAGAKLLEQMPQLESLSLRQEGRLTDEALKSVGKLTNLTELRLASYVGTARLGRMRFSAAGIRHLAELNSLEVLDLTGHDTPPDVLDLPQLTSLSLGGTKVDDRCAERIASMRRLRSLSLTFTGITDAGLKQIGTLPELRSLGLDSSVVTNTGIGHLTNLSKLVHLQVRCANVSDAALGHISEIRSLASLDLSGSGRSGSFSGSLFTGEGLSHLSALPRLRRLAINNLRGDNISDGLSKVTQLHHLNLMMVGLRLEELDVLSDAMPDATINYMTGAWGETRLPKRLRDQGVNLKRF